MNSYRKKSEKDSQSRRGSVYVAVLGVSIIVAVISIASVHVARIEVREATALDDMARARLSARSGVECALAKLKADNLWRTTHASGVANVLAGLSTLLGTGSNSYTLVDSDGNLNDNTDDTVTLRCVGTAGNARHVIEVMLAPTGEGLGCLSAAIHTNEDADVDASLTTNQTVSANGTINCNGGSINGNAQACGAIGPPGRVSGTSSSGMTALQMPDSTGVFEYYTTMGTPISYASLSGGVIERVVLSATNNPYGTGVTNPQGIYIIDCQGGNVTIRNCRIVGTLVFRNVGAYVQLSNSVNWEPYVANFPAMMVEGSLILSSPQNQALSEVTNATNFNPSHTPYLSQSDSSYSDGDTYPCAITGLVYNTGYLWVTNQALVNGTTVSGRSVYVTSNSTFNYKSVFLTNPPPGFTAGNQVEVVPGTWKQASY
jgi:hypothetical protein